MLKVTTALLVIEKPTKQKRSSSPLTEWVNKRYSHSINQWSLKRMRDQQACSSGHIFQVKKQKPKPTK